MVRHGVHPYSYIENYLYSDNVILSEWLGSFFTRLGNAWDAFWKEPNPEDNPEKRLETAKGAMNDLHSMLQQNVGADESSLSVVLQGLEQSLEIMNKIEPTVKNLSGSIVNYNKTGTPHQDPNDGLPEDLHNKWMEIMGKHDQIIKSSEHVDIKAQKLKAANDELWNFKNQLLNMSKSINPHDNDPNKAQYKQKIEKFLNTIDNSATFRQIQNLLNYAKRRMGDSGLLHDRPEGHGEVVMALRQIANTTADPTQQRQKLFAWYQTLPQDNAVKAFIQQEIKENPQLGNEQQVFFKYADDWINKYQHPMGS